FCGKGTPTGYLRCPKCKSPIEEGWKNCSHCGFSLETSCPSCKKITFFGSNCQHCGAALKYIDPGQGKK
ncbi:MAG: zinc ribbon domain-containing protein, partial [Acidobacteria bacterium]|nr:zinc ribbon domain-containing protein [Acidobacteriota bacterium]